MYLISNAHIVNEGRSFKGSILVKEERISTIYRGEVPQSIIEQAETIDATDCWLFPGVIDDHVHFRDPGLTHKADFYTESRAAVAGGVTSVMDMPNTKPLVTTVATWEEKNAIAAEKSMVNYAFYLGATNSNLDELKQLDPSRVCGVKLFMGSSTGNMLVDNKEALAAFFSELPVLIAVHAEDEETIKKNTAHYKELYGDEIPIKCHPQIRSSEACFKSSSLAIELAKKYNARLHVLHLSTMKELALFENKPIEEKRITAEVCPHYLWFCDLAYDRMGSRIKCNPAIKSELNQDALISALSTNKIDVIGTDHAPHLLSEKEGFCMQAMSGTPQIQHSLLVLLELAKRGKISVETVVRKMCHNPAKLFGIKDRGFIRKGYIADLVVVRRKERWAVTDENSLSKCGWSPYSGQNFTTKVAYTFVNGKLVYNEGKFDEEARGEALSFSHEQ